MARAHLYRPLQSGTGDVVRLASVRVLDPVTGNPVATPLYRNRTGPEEWENPLAVSTGVVDFYCDDPTFVDLEVSVGNQAPIVIRDVLVPAPSPSPIEVDNEGIPVLTIGDAEPAAKRLVTEESLAAGPASEIARNLTRTDGERFFIQALVDHGVPTTASLNPGSASIPGAVIWLPPSEHFVLLRGRVVWTVGNGAGVTRGGLTFYHYAWHNQAQGLLSAMTSRSPIFTGYSQEEEVLLDPFPVSRYIYLGVQITRESGSQTAVALNGDPNNVYTPAWRTILSAEEQQ